MNITSAVFRCSSQKLSQCPADNRWEFAFIGRSNVGKSSLINMLTDSPALAKVSATPGKTRLINHFLINGSWYLVDLPGYGYARVSKGQRKEFSKLILDYILKREQMYFLFVLVDSRLEPQKIDLDFMSLLGEHGIPFGIVFTKCDKLSANQTEFEHRTLPPHAAGELGGAPADIPHLVRKAAGPRADPRFYRDMPRRCAGTSGPTRKRRT